MKLYGHPWSTNARKVMVAVAEKGHRLDVEVLHIPRGEHKAPAHLALHPFGKIPVLDDQGFVIYEAAAILRYLDEVLDGPALWPSTPRERARALQWDRVHQSYFEPVVGPFLVQAMFSRHLGFTPDPEVLERMREALAAALAATLDPLDRHLAEAPFLAGESFSLADITWLPYLEYLDRIGHGEPIHHRPNVAAWFARIAGRPSWQTVGRSGMQPYHDDAHPDVIAARHGWRDAAA